jgi:putative ABC transport system substrate-binding protein
MRRREFIALLGGAAAAWPRAARAQTERKRIGWFTVAPHPYVDAFRRRMRELGWIEESSDRIYLRGRPS